MSVVANVAVNLDATSVVQRLKQIREGALGADAAFKRLSAATNNVTRIVQGTQGGFAKASEVLGVFNAKVKNTENAIKAQIAALRAVQGSVQLGGALYQKAGAQIKEYEDALKKARGESDEAGKSTLSLKDRITTFVAGLALATTAVNTVKNSLSAAFERNQAETRLKALTAGFGETEAAMKLASKASDKFGLTQTDATKAIADVYGRLRPLGFSLKDVSGVYEGFSVLSKKAALSTAEASSVFTQLSQALGSGVLRGDEFNRMAESMPSILGIVAKELGVNQNALRGMAADGKITGDVVVRALSKVATSAGDLEAFLDPSQRALNALAKNAEEASVQFGRLLAPAAIGVLDGLANALGFLATNMKQIVQVAVFFGTFAGTLKLIALGTQAWANASKLLAAGQKAAGVAAAFLQGVMNPAALANIALALGAATAASFALGAAMDGAAADATKIDPAAQKAAAATTKAEEAANKLKVEMEKAKKQATALAIEMQTKVVAAAKAASAAIDAQITARGNVGSIVAAQLSSEQKLNELYKVGLDRQYAMATSAGERYRIAIQIANNEIRSAQLAYQATKAQLLIENEVLKLQEQQAVLKGYEILAEGKLAILQAKSPEEARLKTIQLNEALTAQNRVIQATAAEGAARRVLNGFVAQTAETQYKVQVATAAAGLEQKLLSKEIGLSASSAASLSTGIYNSATNTATMNGLSAELSGRMSAASQSLNAGTEAAKANAYQFELLAVSGTGAAKEWTGAVSTGVTAQQQVANAAVQTTNQVVAANNIRSLSATQADTAIVASSNATYQAINTASVTSVTAQQDNWSALANWFTNNVSQPIAKAWDAMARALPDGVVKAITDITNAIGRFFNWMIDGIRSNTTQSMRILYQIFVEPFVVLWERVLRKPVDDFLNWFGKSFNDLAGFFVQKVVNPIERAWKSLTDFLSNATEKAATGSRAAWNAFASWFNSSVVQPIAKYWNGLVDGITSRVQSVRNAVVSIWSNIVNAVTGGIAAGIRGVIGATGNIINSIIGGLNKLIAGINKVRAAVGLSTFSFVPTVAMPSFAEGGVVKGPTVALVGEGGEPEYIIPESKMAQASANYLSGARGGSVIPAMAEGGYVGSGAQINVTTGPVMQQGGEKYVTMKDLEKAMRQTADGVYASLRTSSGRFAIGAR